MFELAQIYQEAKYDPHDLLRLHRIFKQLGVEEHDIRVQLQFLYDLLIYQLRSYS
jgi:hypothetical protein